MSLQHRLIDGATIQAFEAGFCATPKSAPALAELPLRLRSAPRDLVAGDLVTCHAGLMYAGYEGAVGCTIVCSADSEAASPENCTELWPRLERLRTALVDACRPGASIRRIHSV